MKDFTIYSDLAIGMPFIAGQSNPIHNCWHYFTDGASVEQFFNDRDSFIFGMNLIYFLSIKYGITVLAFVLMETHVHFILYGDFAATTTFMHKYVREIAIHTRNRLGYEHPMRMCRISHQEIKDDLYLRTAISYVLRNPLVAGMPFSPVDYPWGSGSLYFRNEDSWCSPHPDISGFKRVGRVKYMKVYATKRQIPEGIDMIGTMIHPCEYTAVELVEKIFRSHKGFFFHLGRAREDEIEKFGGVISNLSIPREEMREHKKEVCHELFGVNDIRKLKTEERIRLARTLKSRYNSSPKQIARLCGLVYEEVGPIL